MAKRKISTKKIKRLIILIIIIVILVIGLFVIINSIKEKPKKETVKVIDTVKDYELSENETEYYKGLFNQLKEALNKDVVDEDAYARLIGQLFISDFFNLDNKLNKNDIGGTQFVYEPFRSDFEKLARDSIYHGIENNIYGDRKQELPIVYGVDIVEIKQNSYDYLEQTDDEAYYLDLIIKYEKDLDYQENVSLILIHNDDKLEVAEMSK